jgi:hypothetical protein
VRNSRKFRVKKPFDLAAEGLARKSEVGARRRLLNFFTAGIRVWEAALKSQIEHATISLD